MHEMKHLNLQCVFTRRFFLYLGVGAGTFTIDIAALALLHNYFHLSLALSATTAFWLSVLFNFFTNRTWVFSASESSQLHRHALMYGLLLVLNYIYTLVALSLLGKYVGYITAKIIILTLQISWTYPTYRYIIFRDDKTIKTEEE